MKNESIDTKQLSNLLLKIAGILLLILSIDNIHYYIWVYLQFKVKTFPLFISTVILPNILQLLFSLTLFFIPDKVTNKIIKNTYPTGNNQNNLHQVEQLSLTILGYYLLTKSLAQLVFQIANFVQATTNIPYESIQSGYSLIFTPDFIALIAEFILGFWLVLGSKGIINAMKKMRE